MPEHLVEIMLSTTWYKGVFFGIVLSYVEEMRKKYNLQEE